MKGINLKVSVWLIFLTNCIFLVSAFPSEIETKKDTNLSEEIYHETYNFHFRKVDSIINSNDHLYKKDLLFNLATINYYWWKLISGEENGKYAELISERIQTIEDEYSKKTTNLEHEQLFLLVSIFAFNVRLSLFNGSIFATIPNFIKYHTFLKLTIGHENEYHPFYLTSGLYNFSIGLAKEKHPVFYTLFSIYSTGNIDHGIKYLKNAASSDQREISQEAQYFLMKIYLDVYKNPSESGVYCSNLLELYPENLLFQQYMFKNDLANGNVANASSRIMLMESIAKSNSQLTIDEKEYYLKQVRNEFYKYMESNK